MIVKNKKKEVGAHIKLGKLGNQFIYSTKIFLSGVPKDIIVRQHMGNHYHPLGANAGATSIVCHLKEGKLH